MAKATDNSKIERIRAAAISIISSYGITGSSVAAIAAEAGVSAGYLYRHYPGKENLINDILKSGLEVITDRINTLINTNRSLEGVVSGVVEFIFNGAAAEPDKYKFMIMLLNDFSVNIHPDTAKNIENIAAALRNSTLDTDVQSIATEDLYMALVGIPLQYLSAEYKFGFRSGSESLENLIKRISGISVAIIYKAINKDNI